MKVGDIYKTNNCGLVKVIEYKNNQRVRVEFLDTKSHYGQLSGVF